MTIFTNPDHDDLNSELVAVTYTGSRSAYQNQAPRNQGYWPGNNAFQRGQVYLADLPERGLGWWEGHQDFEIEYDPATIAAAMLDANYLPPELFGANYSRELRQRAFEKLGLEPSMEEEGYREQLREVAGRDEPEETGDEPTSREEELMSEYERSDYKRAIKAIERADDQDYIDLNQSNKDMVAFLASDERDADRVDKLLEGTLTADELVGDDSGGEGE